MSPPPPIDEDTDPRVVLDRLQIEAHGRELGSLRGDFDKLFTLVRKIAAKLGVEE